MPNLRSTVRWMAEQTARLTGLERFGDYLTLLFEVDMLFGNEDRHLNNIAVLRRGEDFGYCPIFDFGAGLLSNTQDYPMDIEPKSLVKQLHARPLDTTFGRQVQAAREIFGPQLQCGLTMQDISDALEKPLKLYAKRDAPFLRDRVEMCIRVQRKKLGV